MDGYIVNMEADPVHCKCVVPYKTLASVPRQAHCKMAKTQEGWDVNKGRGQCQVSEGLDTSRERGSRQATQAEHQGGLQSKPSKRELRRDVPLFAAVLFKIRW